MFPRHTPISIITFILFNLLVFQFCFHNIKIILLRRSFYLFDIYNHIIALFDLNKFRFLMHKIQNLQKKFYDTLNVCI